MNAWTVVAGTAPLLAGVASWGIRNPQSQLFGPTIRRIDSPEAIALTFDDGPNPAATPRVLDVLERYGAHATFFVIGRRARAFPHIVADAAARGHTIGNHTYTHPNLVWLSGSGIVSELSRCQKAVEDATGHRPLLMRPPFGLRGPQLNGASGRAGLRSVVMWTILGNDWSARGQRTLFASMAPVRSGDIIALHDGYHGAAGADRTATVSALEYWLPRWSDAGLRCVALRS